MSYEEFIASKRKLAKRAGFNRELPLNDRLMDWQAQIADIALAVAGVHCLPTLG